MSTFAIDHDLHIHSELSLCSSDKLQTKENILEYGIKNGLKTLCITDHFWDDAIEGAPEWYRIQNLSHIKEILPLPRAEGVRFLFGCETEMDMNFDIKTAPEHYDLFDFIIVPTTHLHMSGLTINPEIDGSNERRAKLCEERLRALVNSDMPEGKTGIAHLTCSLLAGNAPFKTHIDIINMIPDSAFIECFTIASKRRYGIELNFPSFRYNEAEIESILRPYRIALECGCKFYLGSDAHHPKDLGEAAANFKNIVKLLKLEEKDKFIIGDCAV